MSALPQFNERRTATRLEIQASGMIKTMDGSKFTCTIKNISSRGALLLFQRPTIVPRFFRLSIPSYGFEAVCEKRHATTDDIGVLFTSNRRRAEELFASPYLPAETGVDGHYRSLRLNRTRARRRRVEPLLSSENNDRQFPGS